MIDKILLPIRFVVWLVAVVIWAVVGFVVWIPFLARLTANYLLTLLSSTLRDVHIEEAVASLHRGITFYVDGFEKSLPILLRKRKKDEPFQAWGLSLRNLYRLGGELLYTAGFWLVLVLLVGRLPVRGSGACIPLTGYCITHESADARLVGVWSAAGASSIAWQSVTFERSGDIRISTVPRPGSGRSSRLGRFYTNGDTLLVIMSAPPTDILRLTYRVGSERLGLFRLSGAGAGAFVLVARDEDNRLRRLLKVDYIGQSRRLWEWLTAKLRALLPNG